jgi:hypothetical protein
MSPGSGPSADAGRGSKRGYAAFIECGDPHHGFARLYCDACGHDWLLAEGFRRAVLGFLVGKGAVSGELHSKPLGWRHSGFSVHNRVRVSRFDHRS